MNRVLNTEVEQDNWIKQDWLLHRFTDSANKSMK